MLVQEARSVIRGLTSGRCQKFTSSSRALDYWLNALTINVIVHRMVYTGLVSPFASASSS
jgi:hypothetical protein